MEIRSYGVALALAVIVASGLTARAAARAGRDPLATLSVCGFVSVGAFGGAWLAFVGVQLARGTPVNETFHNAGLVFFGAPIGGTAALVFVSKRVGIHLGFFLDSVVPAVPIAHAIGRMGCFLAGCCYGRPASVPWAVRYLDAAAPAAHPPLLRHPVQLYESAALLALALGFALVPPRNAGRGRRLMLYFALYGVLRVWIELYRGDSVRGLFAGGTTSTSQIVGALLAVTMVALLYITRERLRTPPLLILALVAIPPAETWADEYVRMDRSAIVWIRAGWFEQGLGDREMGRMRRLCESDPSAAQSPSCEFDTERPRHRTWVSAFGIDRTEVTSAAWDRCVAAHVCPPSRTRPDDARIAGPALPVASVTWSEARTFCSFAGGRLPTEAEWERAARGPDGRLFPWGNRFQRWLANVGASAGGPDAADGVLHAAAVGSFPDGASRDGVVDLAGNVWEWTADAFVERAYDDPRSRTNPRWDASTGSRVVRGGSWLAPPAASRSTARFPLAEEDHRVDVGLRCAYDPPVTRAAPGV